MPTDPGRGRTQATAVRECVGLPHLLVTTGAMFGFLVTSSIQTCSI